MNPMVREYLDDRQLFHGVNELASQGISPRHVHVLAHEGHGGLSTRGWAARGLGSVLSNMIESGSRDLWETLRELGCSRAEAEVYTDKLEQGRILLFVTRSPYPRYGPGPETELVSYDQGPWNNQPINRQAFTDWGDDGETRYDRPGGSPRSRPEGWEAGSWNDDGPRRRRGRRESWDDRYVGQAAPHPTPWNDEFFDRPPARESRRSYGWTEDTAREQEGMPYPRERKDPYRDEGWDRAGREGDDSPAVYEYKDGRRLARTVEALVEQGVHQRDLYVLAYEDSRIHAERTGANTIGLSELGLGRVIRNIFNSKEREIRNKLQEIGISPARIPRYEEKLAQGHILLIITRSARYNGIESLLRRIGRVRPDPHLAPENEIPSAPGNGSADPAGRPMRGVGEVTNGSARSRTASAEADRFFAGEGPRRGRSPAEKPTDPAAGPEARQADRDTAGPDRPFAGNRPPEETRHPEHRNAPEPPPANGFFAASPGAPDARREEGLSIREYGNDEALVRDVRKLVERGVPKRDIYVLARDKDRTEVLADEADANTIGLSELGLGTLIENFFSPKDEELKRKLEEIGIPPARTGAYEETLREGKVLLLLRRPGETEEQRIRH